MICSLCPSPLKTSLWGGGGGRRRRQMPGRGIYWCPLSAAPTGHLHRATHVTSGGLPEPSRKCKVETLPAFFPGRPLLGDTLCKFPKRSRKATKRHLSGSRTWLRGRLRGSRLDHQVASCRDTPSSGSCFCPHSRSRQADLGGSVAPSLLGGAVAVVGGWTLSTITSVLPRAEAALGQVQASD